MRRCRRLIRRRLFFFLRRPLRPLFFLMRRCRRLIVRRLFFFFFCFMRRCRRLTWRRFLFFLRRRIFLAWLRIFFFLLLLFLFFILFFLIFFFLIIFFLRRRILFVMRLLDAACLRIVFMLRLPLRLHRKMRQRQERATHTRRNTLHFRPWFETLFLLILQYLLYLPIPLLVQYFLLSLLQ